MSAKAFIDIDDTEENNATLDNQDIFDIVTNKIVDEPENAEEPVRTQVTHKEASECLDTLMNYIQDSDDFCEADFFMLQKLSTRIDLVRQKSKIQANISNCMAPLIEHMKNELNI